MEEKSFTQTIERRESAPAWHVGHRLRDVEAGPDGALWMLGDANPGGP